MCIITFVDPELGKIKLQPFYQFVWFIIISPGKMADRLQGDFIAILIKYFVLSYSFCPECIEGFYLDLDSIHPDRFLYPPPSMD